MSQATQVLNDHWSGELPVNPVALANSLGVAVVCDPALPSVCRIEMRKASVWVSLNAAEPAPRQRFALAHALGHLCAGDMAAQAHHVDTAASYNRDVGDLREQRANAFALELLMPERVLRYSIETRRASSVQELARIFQVAEVAVRQRLKDLGILS